MLQMMYSGGGWMMMGICALALVVLVLAGAASIKYLFFDKRSGS